MNNRSFWKFNAWDKHDELLEDRHLHLYYGALSDPDTGIEEFEINEFILYGPDEALLIRPKRFLLRLGLHLLGAFLSLKHE